MNRRVVEGLYHAHADRLAANTLTERGGYLCQKCLRTKEAGGGPELLQQREKREEKREYLAARLCNMP